MKRKKYLTLTSLVLASLNSAYGAIVIDSQPYAVDNTLVITSSVAASGFQGAEAFNGVANGSNRWATAFSEGENRNEWLMVDLGQDVNLNTISLNWETARANDWTWRIRTDAQGLPAIAPTQGVPGSITFSDWTQIASVTDALSIGNNTDLGNPDQTFNFTTGTASSTNAGDGAITAATGATGRYLLMAITEQWSRPSNTDGSSPYEIAIDATSVPEPSSMFLSVVGLAFLARRKRA